MIEVFKNKYLLVTKKDDNENTTFHFDFLGHKSIMHCTSEWVQNTIDKRVSAYNLIPDECVKISKKEESNLNGLLIGGVLEDSIRIVYGIGTRDGINGYSCSVYFIPNAKAIDSFLKYDALQWLK